MTITTRFAPSPTGYLHLGHAFAALWAREHGDRVLLRIEDIDATRCKPEYEAAILQDLTWLGFVWDSAVLRQSARLSAYRAALESLKRQGLIYPCFCTRSEIAEEIARAGAAPHGPEGAHYPGTCRHLSEDERAQRMAATTPYALRLDSAKAAEIAGSLSFEEQGAGPDGEHGRIPVDPRAFGDIVLARKDTPSAYHLAVVVDDAFQGVTLVTRGHDLFAAAQIQRVLQTLLGLPEPAYAHHPLILDATGKKFSKRDRAVTLRALREQGWTSKDVEARLQASAAAMISRR